MCVYNQTLTGCTAKCDQSKVRGQTGICQMLLLGRLPEIVWRLKVIGPEDKKQRIYAIENIIRMIYARLANTNVLFYK